MVLTFGATVQLTSIMLTLVSIVYFEIDVLLSVNISVLLIIMICHAKVTIVLSCTVCFVLMRFLCPPIHKVWFTLSVDSYGCGFSTLLNLRSIQFLWTHL